MEEREEEEKLLEVKVSSSENDQESESDSDDSEHARFSKSALDRVNDRDVNYLIYKKAEQLEKRFKQMETGWDSMRGYLEYKWKSDNLARCKKELQVEMKEARRQLFNKFEECFNDKYKWSMKQQAHQLEKALALMTEAEQKLEKFKKQSDLEDEVKKLQSEVAWYKRSHNVLVNEVFELKKRFDSQVNR